MVIYFLLQLKEIQHVKTYWVPSTKILLHFYDLEVPQDRIKEIEREALEAHDYGGEVCIPIETHVLTIVTFIQLFFLS